LIVLGRKAKNPPGSFNSGINQASDDPLGLLDSCLRWLLASVWRDS
jgi:hypothetical protein